MKIAVTGPREPPMGTLKLVQDWVNTLPANTVLLHGNANGVDAMAYNHATFCHLPTVAFKPDYKRYPGPLAPLVRNAEMVSQADALCGFWHGMPSGGTCNTLWAFWMLHKRQPQWFLTGIHVAEFAAQAQQNFDQVCKHPPAHWVEALNLWLPKW